MDLGNLWQESGGGAAEEEEGKAEEVRNWCSVQEVRVGYRGEGREGRRGTLLVQCSGGVCCWLFGIDSCME